MNTFDIPYLKISITAIIILLTYLIYKHVLKPYKIYKYNVQKISENYKTHAFPFSLTSSVINENKKNV